MHDNAWNINGSRIAAEMSVVPRGNVYWGERKGISQVIISLKSADGLDIRSWYRLEEDAQKKILKSVQNHREGTQIIH